MCKLLAKNAKHTHLIHIIWDRENDREREKNESCTNKKKKKTFHSSHWHKPNGNSSWKKRSKMEIRFTLPFIWSKLLDCTATAASPLWTIHMNKDMGMKRERNEKNSARVISSYLVMVPFSWFKSMPCTTIHLLVECALTSSLHPIRSHSIYMFHFRF